MAETVVRSVAWLEANPLYDEQRMKDICKRGGEIREMIGRYPGMVPAAFKQLWYDSNYLIDLVETAREVGEFGRKPK